MFRLAAQREAYLKEKYQRQKDLKSALDHQVSKKLIEISNEKIYNAI